MRNKACIFPGQGSQSVGMLGEIATVYPQIERTFQEASDILGYDTWDLASVGPIEQLNKTEFTQPLLLIASVAIWKLALEQGMSLPSMMAGHSLGEYSALVCADALSFEDAVLLVAQRGRFMQEAVLQGQGAMAAVLGAESDMVDKLCEESRIDDEVLSAVNDNAPGQIVIAGHASAVDRAIAHAKQMGIKRVLLLPVSVPSHCALMLPAAKKLAEKIAKIEMKMPAVPVIHNVNAKTSSSVAEIKEALVQQLYSPVRWRETIQKMTEQGIEEMVEIGSGTVLTGLTKRIAPEVITKNTSTLEMFQEAISSQGIEK